MTNELRTNESPAALLQNACDDILNMLPLLAVDGSRLGPVSRGITERFSELADALASTAPGASENDWFCAFAMPVGELLGCLPSSFAGGNQHIIRKLRELVATSESRGSVPDGWMLVPQEPTDDMRDAMAKTCGGCTFGYHDRETNTYETDRKKAGEIYHAALAAAPTPPAVASGEPTAEHWKQAIKDWHMHMSRGQVAWDWIECRACELARSAAAKGEGQEKPR